MATCQPLLELSPGFLGLLRDPLQNGFECNSFVVSAL